MKEANPCAWAGDEVGNEDRLTFENLQKLASLCDLNRVSFYLEIMHGDSWM